MQAPHLQADVESFYSLPDVSASSVYCCGTACFVARHRNLDDWCNASSQSPRLYCLGKCYVAPATGTDRRRPNIEVRSRTGIVLERIARGGARTFDEYRRDNDLGAIRAALVLDPAKVIEELKLSQLRGRGGAGYPTGAKWRIAATQVSPEKYVVANLDEGDPGAYIDRFIAEDDPYCVIEGMVIAARAIGATKGWIYVRREYPEAINCLKSAITGARAGGLLGPRVLGSGLSFDVELKVGGGSYVCGEETALLNSIEGNRPVARARPPYVAERGLWGKPTVVNNAETLANIPWILRHGGRAYATLGIPGSRGTKVVSLNSLFRRPGLYEIEFGIPLQEIVKEIGGGLRSGTLYGLMIGGPLAGVVPPDLFETRFGFDELAAIGACVGHGGIIAFDERTTIAELVHHVFQFGAYESCGNCTPCRLGAPRIEEIFRRIRWGEAASKLDRAEWQKIVEALKLASLCGLGSGLAEFAESIMQHYATELDQCFA
jgi:NADH:ubiquinone oxidoreductase subunit F (NADH-binding)